MWLKLDAIVPIEWANDGAIPANAELQFVPAPVSWTLT
jgi:hypothetical protein